MNSGIKNMSELFDMVTGKTRLHQLNISDIRSKKQVREEFENIEELANDIKDKGLLQPIVVYEDDEGVAKYVVLMGERRFRAVKHLGLEQISAIVNQKPKDIQERILLQLAENIQRDNLSVVEIGKNIQLLINEGYSQTDVAELLNKSDAYVSRHLAMVNLPECLETLRVEKQLGLRTLVNLKQAYELDPAYVTMLADAALEDENNSITTADSVLLLKTLKSLQKGEGASNAPTIEVSEHNEHFLEEGDEEILIEQNRPNPFMESKEEIVKNYLTEKSESSAENVSVNQFDDFSPVASHEVNVFLKVNHDGLFDVDATLVMDMISDELDKVLVRIKETGNVVELHNSNVRIVRVGKYI